VSDNDLFEDASTEPRPVVVSTTAQRSDPQKGAAIVDDSNVAGKSGVPCLSRPKVMSAPTLVSLVWSGIVGMPVVGSQRDDASCYWALSQTALLEPPESLASKR